ncbi:hypothetical protein [Teredinibacter haidensis]|uniref:hypothetical protein n=1 Tax=Teredinibacter haidensis TaxID=2731755 RepID=UPI000948B5F7|nr:hypothetical protein [Teredinibacter haidensis]
MPDNIDYKFLNDPEGGGKRKAYIPAANVRKKNTVTITTPAEPQTVAASVSFPYDVNLDGATQKLWKVVSEPDWKQVLKVLNTFGDSYPISRVKKAGLLENIGK